MSGESKQIDEDENGPENGGLKSGPCLIAGFHALSCTSPSYYNPYRGVNKNTLPDGAAALLLAEAKSWCGAVMCYSSTCITA